MKVGSWEEADQALLELGGLDRKLGERKIDAESRIAKIREALKRVADPLKKTRTKCLKALATFVRKYQDQLEGRSRKLTHGKVGLRLGPPYIELELAEETVINRLKARQMHHCIRVKEEVSLEALHAYDDQTLAALGCKRDQDEEFWYDVPRVES